MRKLSPGALIVRTGCYAQAFSEQAQQIAECDIITGTSKADIPKLIEEFRQKRERLVRISAHEKNEPFEPMTNRPSGSKTRAFVKIQDGCDCYCSYCIIPYARGHIRSKPLADLESEISALAQGGYREIVLTGINLCFYGKDFGDGTRLADAVETACSINGIERDRLRSREPERIREEDERSMRRLEKL